MATQKPISTISYNTLPFLREKLSDLYNAHIIQAFQFIFHKGEDGDKDHIHLRIEPNKRIDQMELTTIFIEHIYGEEKPRAVRPWRPSKEEDWILYAVHDPVYLREKYGEVPQKGEKMPYSWTQIEASPLYDVETMYIRAKAKLERTQSNIFDRLEHGESYGNLVKEGVPVSMLNQLAYILTRDNTLQELIDTQKDEIRRLYSAIENAGFTVITDGNGITSLEPLSKDPKKSKT